MTEATPELTLRITSTAELLKAVELGILDKTEARSLLGFGVKRGRWAAVQPREGGRFAKGQILPFNRFSDDAKEVLLLAQEHSRADGRTQVATRDLLFGLLERAEGPAAAVLERLGVTILAVEAALAGTSVGERALDRLGTTAELKDAMELAFRSVAYPDQVGTEHLLLALASSEGQAGTVLTQLGAGEGAIRTALDRRSEAAPQS